MAKKKKDKAKKLPSYKQGHRDADLLLTKVGLSLWFVSHCGFYSGLQRKSGQSDKRLSNYCNGFQDRVKEEAERLGDGVGQFGFPSSKVIGK